MQTPAAAGGDGPERNARRWVYGWDEMVFRGPDEVLVRLVDEAVAAGCRGLCVAAVEARS